MKTLEIQEVSGEYGVIYDDYENNKIKIKIASFGSTLEKALGQVGRFLDKYYKV